MPRTTAPRVTHNDKVLARLRRGPATHLELYQLGVMAHSRIAELRRRGYPIPPAERVTAEDGTALYVYRLEDAA
jgi:hypothetical protein